MDFRPVQSEHIDQVWPYIRGYIEAALDHGHGEWTANDIREAAKQHDTVIWIGTQENVVMGAFTTFFVSYPRYKVCVIGFGGTEDTGETLWSSFLPIVASWAKHNGCARVVVEGRKGWEKKLKTFGYSLDSVKMGIWI